MNELYKPSKIEPDELPDLGEFQQPDLTPQPLPKIDNDMSKKKKSKFRLDFWKKAFWQEPHILGSVFHSAADVFLPQKATKALGLVEDFIDDGKLNSSQKQGSKSYWIIRSVFTVVFMAALVWLVVSQVITFEQALDAIERLLIPIFIG